MKKWGTPKEIETRRRVKLALWAYAYEFEQHSIVEDAVFDFESYMVDLNIETDRLDLDYWFRAEFIPDTGLWIHKHPDLDKIKNMYKWNYDENQNLRTEHTIGEFNERFLR